MHWIVLHFVREICVTNFQTNRFSFETKKNKQTNYYAFILHLLRERRSHLLEWTTDYSDFDESSQLNLCANNYLDRADHPSIIDGIRLCMWVNDCVINMKICQILNQSEKKLHHFFQIWLSVLFDSWLVNSNDFCRANGKMCLRQERKKKH